MAFDAAPSSASPSASDLLSTMGARVYTLHQAAGSVASLSGSLGGPADTPALRARLDGLYAECQRLADEIEKGLLSARVMFMKAGVDHGNARALMATQTVRAA